MFDLPVVTPEERKAATDFRKFLLDQGFERAQYSVYLRFCVGREKWESLLRRVRYALPPDGKIDVLQFTDKQYENIISFYKQQKLPPRKNPEQYILF